MKTIKMMLFSLALLAVVGGALAFKARYKVLYCTSTYANQATPPTSCSFLVQSTTSLAPINATFWTASPTIVAGVATCKVANVAIPCTSSTFLKID